MTEGFALDYIPRRMKELGYTEYSVRYRKFVLMPRASITIPANNQYFFLIDPHPSFIVKSKFGAYDLVNPGANEMQFEHRGKITISNTGMYSDPRSSDVSSVLITFIQVIPLHKKK